MLGYRSCQISLQLFILVFVVFSFAPDCRA